MLTFRARMLQTIHDKLKGIFAIAILAALGVVFVFWGVDVSVGTFTRAQGIEVNGNEVNADDVRNEYQQALTQYQVALGTGTVPEDIRSELQKSALESAVRAELVRERTRKLRYAVSDADVLAQIRSIRAFQVGGEFSPDAYHAALNSIGMSPERFEAEQRDLALARQLDRAVSASAFVLQPELERAVALRHESRELAWVVLPAADFAGAAKVDDAALEAWYRSHRQEYQTDETAVVDYVEIRLADEEQAIAIDETRLREYFESVKERYTTAGRRRASHILVATGDDPAKAEAEAQELFRRAKQGDDFAKLARENSDDPGSAAAGGDLGFSERGDFVAAFGDAVWGMQPGEIRGPIKTEFGWHVIRLDAIEPGSSKSFEDVRADLEAELRRNEVEKAFGDKQEELDRLAFEANGDLAAVAGKMSLPIRREAHFTRAGGAALGMNPPVIEAVFAPDTLAGRELRTVEIETGHVVALRVAAYEPARDRPLAEVREAVEASVRQDQAAKLAAERAAGVVAELGRGATWQAATASWQGGSAATRQPRLLRRDDPGLPDPVRVAAFRAPRPEGGARYGTAALDNGDSAIWMVSAVREGSLAALSPNERDLELQSARERAAILDGSAYVLSLRGSADVDVNPKIFE